MGRDLWHARSGCDSFQLTADRLYFTWRPMEGVTIRTVIAPWGMWHVRKHVIRNEYPVEAAEGAFAVPKDWAGARPCDRLRSCQLAGADFADAHGQQGTSAIYALTGYEEGQVIQVECNTNLLYPRTVLPSLLAQLPPGESTLCCAVYCDTGDLLPEKIPQEVLTLAHGL